MLSALLRHEAGVGACVGVAVEGAPVGLSVLSQQPRNVVPSIVGQHCMPLGNPKAAHRGCIAQSLSDVGDRVGDRVGANVSHLLVHTLPSSATLHTPLAQSASTWHPCPPAHASHLAPPQSTPVSS